MINNNSNYYIASHIFVCRTGDQYVFLDLHNDKYSCLEPEKSRVLEQLFKENQKEMEDDSKITDGAMENDHETSQLIEELLQSGVLTQDRAQGKSLEAVSLCPPKSDLKGIDPNLKPSIRLPDVINFFSAYIKSSFRLRFLSMEKVINSVKLKKKKYKDLRSDPHRPSAPSSQLSPEALADGTDNNRLEELLQIFYLLRPFAYTAKNQCLQDTLVLLEFFSCYDIYPDWVFGVAMGPFSAHCWVQKDEIVFNDTVAQTASHTPIMIV